MKTGIMQPYFLPYIGYWQLMDVVDQYVILDDVSYIRGGWIDRNRILINGSVSYINLSLKEKSQNLLISDLMVNKDMEYRIRMLRKIERSYGKASYFKDVYPLFKDIVMCEEERLVHFLKHSFEVIADYLGIDTVFYISSELPRTAGMTGEKRIIDICRSLNTSKYINAIGGQKLYNKDTFNENGIELEFLKTDEITYRQHGTEGFYSNLSIIDLLFNVSREDARKMLKSCSTI